MYNPQGTDTPPPAGPKKPLGVLRGIFAAIGIIIMVLSGGCVVLFTVSDASMMSTAFAIAAIPFLVGLGIFLLATRAGR